MNDLGWTTDAQGRRVMLGLTADETAEYQSLLNVSAGVSCEEMQARFASLSRLHETALYAAGEAFNTGNGGGAGAYSRRERPE
ncbi:hypothetical protein D9599_12160 [Roseomonas sp. KE2513]|uniref:hypothetical protein n=1 Tax=Roseomonas sp. KE2513 TaxID=2479202 RepID=UPI0018DF53DC|nr:hypothetical protein [Roseomonas sp. KE2513]MBI0536329.1 hypothetical protein [Roseomonas sp. KE2513]